MVSIKLHGRYDQYDENGYRKDHRVKNERYTSQFDADPTDFGGDSANSECNVR